MQMNLRIKVCVFSAIFDRFNDMFNAYIYVIFIQYASATYYMKQFLFNNIKAFRFS